MRRAIRKQLRPFVLMTGIALVAAVVGGYILAHQRMTWPAWMPVVGEEFFTLSAEFSTAAGVMPGQGQAVTVSGVRVGEIAGVRLENGRAVVDMNLEPRFARVYPDATVLLRPKTGLKDMVIELDPGTRAAGPPLRDGARLSIAASEPDVNFDEILAMLDADTRDYLRLLVADGGKALEGDGGRALARVLRRFEPLSRHAEQATRLVARRRARLRRLMGNLSQIASELGRRDRQLATFVSASAEVFRRFSAQNERLAETLELLPGTLRTTDAALGKVAELGNSLDRSLTALEPSSRALAPTLRKLRPFLRDTAPVLRDELRPFAREAQPTARLLRPAAADLAAATPGLSELTRVLNALLDTLAYDPPGDGKDGQGFLFYVPWANHNTNSVLSTQDGLGATRRGLVMLSCGSLELLESLAAPRRNPTLSTLIQLLGAPDRQQLLAEGKCKERSAPAG